MKSFVPGLILAIGLTTVMAAQARACGFGEAPGGCGDSAENEAKWMLQRVVSAVNTDKTKALADFTRGEAGFRTVDSYVFCVGPTGIMTAHPSPMLQGQDVRELHDKTGNYFIATMMNDATPGKILEIHYLFPRLGSTDATPKTTYYTRAGDQVCGVGVYEGDEAPKTDLSPADRLKQLQDRLNAEMPATAAVDWAAFKTALDEQNKVQLAALGKVRDQLHAVDALLNAAGMPATGN